MTPRRAVVKFGGEVVLRTADLLALLEDVAHLRSQGWSIVVCHGGGPQANALQERLGVATHKVAGRRVTDAATLQIMKCVLAGEVSVDVCAAAAAVAAAFAATFEHAPFVRVLGAKRQAEVVAVKGSMWADVSWTLGPVDAARGVRALVVTSALDNLVKGGAGQAVQSMNLMLGFDETRGIDAVPLWPRRRRAPR